MNTIKKERPMSDAINFPHKKEHGMELSASFSNTQQAALVGHCFYSEEFFLKVKAYIKPEWFLDSDIYVSHIYKELLRFYDKHKKLPQSDEELLAEPFFLSQKKDAFVKYKNTFYVLTQGVQNFSLDVLRPKIAKFVQIKMILEGASGVNQVIKRENYDAVAGKAQDLLTAATSVSFDKPPYVDFADTVTLWHSPVNEKGMSTGSKHLDDMLGGGLFHGENLAVLAPTFVGKSRFLQTVVRHLLVQGYRGIYIIHEDNPDKVKRRIISSIVGMGVKEINQILLRGTEYTCPFNLASWSAEEAEQLRAILTNELERAKELLENNLIFISWQKTANMYVEDVIDEIKRINMSERAKTGKGLDFVFDDYPALLASRAKHEDKRSRLEYCYRQFNVLAAEIHVFVAYAVQVNRSAAKSMKTGEAKLMIGLEDASESYAIAQNATSAISLNRHPQDLGNNVLRISVEKARDSGANSALVTRAAYNEGSLFGDYTMYLKHGQLLAKGLAAVAGSKQVLDSNTLVVQLEEIERAVNLTAMEEWNKMPAIIKKIKGS